MAIVEWPIEAVPPRNVAMAHKYLTRPDQQATNGMVRSVGLSGAPFRVQLIGVQINDEKSARMLRSLLGKMQSNRNLVRFFLPDIYALSGPAADASQADLAQYPNGIPFNNGALFSNGVGFKAGIKAGTIAQAAALNADTLYLNEASAIDAGVWVSIDEKIYTVTSSVMTSAGLNKIEISPGLMRAVAANAPISYAPVFVGKCVTDLPGFEEMDFGRWGRFTFDFIEDLTRFVVL